MHDPTPTTTTGSLIDITVPSGTACRANAPGRPVRYPARRGQNHDATSASASPSDGNIRPVGNDGSVVHDPGHRKYRQRPTSGASTSGFT
ncbi:MAG: hypothetical protein ACE5GW_12065, partial [Planctomycetota bacterium]